MAPNADLERLLARPNDVAMASGGVRRRRPKNSIESPLGGDTAGHPLREHLAHRCQDMEAQAFEADVLWLGNISTTFRPRTAE